MFKSVDKRKKTVSVLKMQKIEKNGKICERDGKIESKEKGARKRERERERERERDRERERE
jgi:hypothetical protein